MSADLAIGVKVGFSAGAAIAGLTSLGRSMDKLGAETQKLTARQRLLGNVLSDPGKMSKQRIGELKREYLQLGIVVDKLRHKHAQLAAVQLHRGNLKQQRGELMGQVMSTVSLGASAVLPVKLAMDFESDMADVKKVVDFDTPAQFKEMSDDILKLTREIPMAGGELAKIAASGGQLGVAREDIIGFTREIAKMSVAFDMSAEIAGESMAKLANVYKIPITGIGKLGDAINELSNNSPAKAENIVNVLGRVGGVAKQFGLSEFQTASLSNAFISLGRTQEVAGTAINGMLTKLMTADKQGAKFQAALKSMGTSSRDLKKAIAENGEQALMDFLKQVEKLPKDQQMGILVDLFGLEYADDVAALVGGLDQYEKSIELLKKTGAGGQPAFLGSMDKEFQARAATTSANWQTFKNSLVELGITVGSTLLPAVNELLNAIKPMITGLSDWANANPGVARSLLGFVAGLALFKISILGSMFSLNILRTAWSFFPGMLHKTTATWLLGALKFRSGSGLIFKSVGLVKTVLGGLRSALPLIKAFGQGLAGGFIGMAKVAWMAVRGLGTGIIRLLPMIGGAFAKLGMFLMANPIFLALGLLAAAAYMLYRNWDDVVGGAKLLWQDLSGFFGGLWQQVSAFFNSGIGNIAATILNWSPLGLVYRAWAGVLSWFGIELPGTLTGAGSLMAQGLALGWQAVVGWVGGIWMQIKTAFGGGILGIGQLILNWSPLGLFYQAFAAVLSWFGISLPATFTGFGQMIIQGLWNGLKAKFEEVKGWFSGMAGWFGSVFQYKNDMHSPSRLFMGFGGYMMQGLQIGLANAASRPLATIGGLASNLQQRFTSRAGELRSNLSARMQAASAEFADARAQRAAAAGGYTIHYSPTINAPGGDAQQIQNAVQMGLREFEDMFNRLMAARERRAY